MADQSLAERIDSAKRQVQSLKNEIEVRVHASEPSLNYKANHLPTCTLARLDANVCHSV
jgi:hypothetical protein